MMWRKGHSYTLMVGIHISLTATEVSVKFLKTTTITTKTELSYDLEILLLDIQPKEMQSACH
jgi:hypothetical protein